MIAPNYRIRDGSFMMIIAGHPRVIELICTHMFQVIWYKSADDKHNYSQP